MKKVPLLFLAIALLLTVTVQASSKKALSSAQLEHLVKGNTMIGLTSHTRSVYVLYFYPDGRLYFRKQLDPKQTYMGRWWVKGDHIYSQWPTYKRKRVNDLKYFHVAGNTYRPYNVKQGCGPAGTYCYPFIVIQGRAYLSKTAP